MAMKNIQTCFCKKSLHLHKTNHNLLKKYLKELRNLQIEICNNASKINIAVNCNCAKIKKSMLNNNKHFKIDFPLVQEFKMLDTILDNCLKNK